MLANLLASSACCCKLVIRDDLCRASRGCIRTCDYLIHLSIIYWLTDTGRRRCQVGRQGGVCLDETVKIVDNICAHLQARCDQLSAVELLGLATPPSPDELSGLLIHGWTHLSIADLLTMR